MVPEPCSTGDKLTSKPGAQEWHSTLCPVTAGSRLAILGRPFEGSATKSPLWITGRTSKGVQFFPQTPSKKQQLPVGSVVCGREELSNNTMSSGIKGFLCFLLNVLLQITAAPSLVLSWAMLKLSITIRLLSQRCSMGLTDYISKVPLLDLVPRKACKLLWSYQTKALLTLRVFGYPTQ